MKPTRIELLELSIPFRFRYGHAKAKHGGVKSVLCIARDAEGNEGFGEAVPRTYVTGETVASVQADLVTLIEGREKAFPESAFPDAVPGGALCALDLALTDLHARQQGESVLDLLGGGEPALTYTASIGMGGGAKLTALLLVYKAMGLRHFKVKVGDENDLHRIGQIRRILGSEVSLFADANGAWDRETGAKRIGALEKLKVWAVEEPLRIEVPTTKQTASGQLCREEEITDQHLADNAWLQARTEIPLIADESLISLRAAERIVAQKAFRIFNIRLSKCGGFSRSAAFAKIARAAGLDFSLGAMVGETPILAAAGAAFGASQPEHLYIQGHSHKLLHGVRFVEGCPPLRRGGRFSANQQSGSGLTMKMPGLEAVTKARRTIDLG